MDLQNHYNRKSIRLKNYDYSKAGLYFITITIKNHSCLLGNIIDNKMILNEAGQMIENQWLKLPQRFHNIRLHEFVVMPNHFHAIVEIINVAKPSDSNTNFKINSKEGRNTFGKRLGDVIGAFESITTIEYIKAVKKRNWKRFSGKLWQRNYWESIIRSPEAYYNISKYIVSNPQKWKEDSLIRDEK